MTRSRFIIAASSLPPSRCLIDSGRAVPVFRAGRSPTARCPSYEAASRDSRSASRARPAEPRGTAGRSARSAGTPAPRRRRPKIAPCGSSTATRITSRGRVAGTTPTNEATYFDVEYPPRGSGFGAVPVLPGDLVAGDRGGSASRPFGDDVPEHRHQLAGDRRRDDPPRRASAGRPRRGRRGAAAPRRRRSRSPRTPTPSASA